MKEIFGVQLAAIGTPDILDITAIYYLGDGRWVELHSGTKKDRLSVYDMILLCLFVSDLFFVEIRSLFFELSAGSIIYYT
mgnify:CR=1 FL=1